jgi:hypothetical protein
MFEFVYKDDILMWEALIWKRVAVDKKTIIAAEAAVKRPQRAHHASAACANQQNTMHVHALDGRQLASR